MQNLQYFLAAKNSLGGEIYCIETKLTTLVLQTEEEKIGFSWIFCDKSEKEPELALKFSTQPNSESQTTFRHSHPHKACNTSFESLKQWWKSDSWRISRFIKFSFVGSEFVQAFQRKCFIFPGTFIFQMLFLKVLWESETWGLFEFRSWSS